MPVLLDLNGDVGEGCGDDEALLRIVTSANVATGAHAGGGDILRQTVRQAVDAGCAVGAHPSYRDLAGFGRTSLADSIDRREFTEDLVRQILDVAVACADHGAPLRHVKAHGALYHDAAHDQGMADVLMDAVGEVAEVLGRTLTVVSAPASLLEPLAPLHGCRFRAEGFADRRYDGAGRLVPRTMPGAVLDDPEQVRAQALSIALQGVAVTVDGKPVDVHARTLCVHGDTPGAVDLADEIRRALTASGVHVTADLDG